MIKVLKSLSIYFIALVIGFLLFAISFRLPLFRNIDIYYYRGISLIVFITLIIGICIFIVKRMCLSWQLDYKDIIVCVVIVASFNMVFLSSVTVAIDRSISVFMLADMAEQKDKVFTEEEIEERFLDIYMEKYEAMERRFEEQLYTGTIVKMDEGYQITDKGIRLINMFRVVSKIFPVDERFLYPSKYE